MADGGGTAVGWLIRYGEDIDGPYSEQALIDADGKVPLGVEIFVGDTWLPLRDGVRRIAADRSRGSGGNAGERSQGPSVYAGSETASDEPWAPTPVNGPTSFRAAFSAGFSQAYKWVLLVVGIVALVRGASHAQPDSPIDMVLEALFGSVFWTAVVGVIFAWRRTRRRPQSGRAPLLAAELNESGPVTATDRVLWNRLQLNERVVFKSNAGVMSYRQATDGALYLTTERLVFVGLRDLVFRELPRPDSVLLGRSSWLNSFVHLGEVEFILPTREVQALEAAVCRHPSPGKSPLGGSGSTSEAHSKAMHPHPIVDQFNRPLTKPP